MPSTESVNDPVELAVRVTRIFAPLYLLAVGGVTVLFAVNGAAQIIVSALFANVKERSESERVARSGFGRRIALNCDVYAGRPVNASK